MRPIVTLFTTLVLAFTLSACGGGGGGDTGACGSIGKIAGGDSCGEGQSNVGLVLVEFTDGSVLQCTGSYISLTSVLTAAHCFQRRVAQVAIGSRGNVRSGVQIIVHPGYNGSVDSPFDMAIVKVDRPLSGAPLPLLLSTSPAPGNTVVAYGYGTDEFGQNGIDRINRGEIPLKATYTTFAGYDRGTSTIISTGAGGTCSGDSGGPVLAQNAAGEFGIIGLTRSGPDGCDAAFGRPSFLSSTQSNGAIYFIVPHAPDAAVN